MKKKSAFAIFTICVAAILSHEISLKAGQDRPNIDFVETKIVDGFFIGVTDEFGHTNTSPDNRLCFSIWTTNKIQATSGIRVTNSLDVVFPSRPEYAYQVELFDTNGVAIPKTEAGKKVGAKFLDFEPHSFVLRSTGPDERPGIKASVTIAQEKIWPYEMFNMFRPSDFFDIKKSGNYTLQIRFQIIAFPRTGPNREDHTNDLIRFPTLDYPLEVNRETKIYR